MLGKYRHTGRNTMRNLVVALLFGSITIVFIFWGLSPRSMGLSQVGAVADVNGELISLADYQNEMNRLTDMYSRYFGNQMPAELQRQMLRGETLRNLIQLELVAQGAAKQGVMVSDAEVKEQIVSLPFLQKDGRFQREYYESYVGQMRTSPAKFEQRVRKIIANQKMSRVFDQAFSPAGVLTVKEETLKKTAFNVQFLKISNEEFPKKFAIDSQRVQAFLAKPENLQYLETYYKARPEKYRRPQKDKTDKKDVEFADVKNEVAFDLLRDEESRNAIMTLQAVVEKADLKAIDSWAAKNGVKWDETGDFNLASASIPKLSSSDTVMREVFALSEKKPLTKKLIADAGYTYVLKFKSRGLVAGMIGAKDDMGEMSSSQLSQEALTQWTEKVKGSAHIQENLAALE